MKVALAGVALAALMASPLFAQSQSTERPDAGAYRDQEKQLRVRYGGFDGSARKSKRPMSNPELTKQWPCSSAPGFCCDYHGGNGS
jgi:hypothetical protein